MHTSGSHGVEQFGLAILGWRDLYETRQPYSLRGSPNDWSRPNDSPDLHGIEPDFNRSDD